MDAIFQWFVIPILGIVVASSVFTGVLEWFRDRRQARRKKELMEWLDYLGKGMDTCWEPNKRHSKDEVKRWIVGVTTSFYKELRKRDGG